MSDKCVWKPASGIGALIDDYWDTNCGEAFYFDTGGIEENGFNFCPYCGKEIEVRDE